MIFSNTLIGIAVMSVRFVLWATLGIFCMGRIDLCLMPGPGALHLADVGFSTYVALVRQDHRYNNPVCIVFFQLLEKRLSEFRRQNARRKVVKNLRLMVGLHRAVRALRGARVFDRSPLPPSNHHDDAGGAGAGAGARARAGAGAGAVLRRNDSDGDAAVEAAVWGGQRGGGPRRNLDAVDVRRSMVLAELEAADAHAAAVSAMAALVNDDDADAEASSMRNPTRARRCRAAARRLRTRLEALPVVGPAFTVLAKMLHGFLHAGSLKVLKPSALGAPTLRLAAQLNRRLASSPDKQEVAANRRRLARNRWQLALMLQTNPGLRQFRGHAIDLRRRKGHWWHTEGGHASQRRLMSPGKGLSRRFSCKLTNKLSSAPSHKWGHRASAKDLRQDKQQDPAGPNNSFGTLPEI